jgi:hypothetical protein
MYSVQPHDDGFQLLKAGQPLRTPMGRLVSTRSELIADKLVEHLELFGEDPSDPQSLVAFHYSYLDFFEKGARPPLEHSVSIGLDEAHDWTYACPSADPHRMMEWWGTFGRGPAQAEAGKEWLATLSMQQLGAVCVVGRALESVNIPFIVAASLKKKSLTAFIKVVDEHYPFMGAKGLRAVLENYLLYFNAETAPAPGASGNA